MPVRDQDEAVAFHRTAEDRDDLRRDAAVMSTRSPYAQISPVFPSKCTPAMMSGPCPPGIGKI